MYVPAESMRPSPSDDALSPPAIDQVTAAGSPDARSAANFTWLFEATIADDGVIEKAPLLALTLPSCPVPHPAANSTSEAMANVIFGLSRVDIPFQRGRGSGSVI